MKILSVLVFLIIIAIILKKKSRKNDTVYKNEVISTKNNLIEIECCNIIKEKIIQIPNFTYFEEDKNINYSNFICGNFYIVKNSEIMYSKKGVFQYELFELNNGQKPISLSKYKYKNGIQENAIQIFPENYLLIVEYCKKVPYRYDFMPFDNDKEYSWGDYLQIYHNGKLIREFENKTYKWKINAKNEILLYHSEDIVKLNLENEKSVIPAQSPLLSYNFNSYLEKTYCDSENLYLYFYEKECELCFILKELCKKADNFEIIPNKFNDDLETINYKATFNKNKIREITMLFYILSKYKLTDSLNKTSLTSRHCFGTAVNKISIELYPSFLNDNTTTNIIKQHDLSDSEKETYKNIVENIYNQYNLPVCYDCYPPDFFEDVSTLGGQYVYYANYLKEEKPTLFVENGYLKKSILLELKNKYEKLKSELVYSGTIKKKWTTEIELFKLTKTYYKDAIYQYHSKWLNRQSLDIYIPSLKIGIEYQGQQHYQPINCFGGEKTFKETLERDKLKKELCKENGVKLIEWKYDEQIVKTNLIKKIKEVSK